MASKRPRVKRVSADRKTKETSPETRGYTAMLGGLLPGDSCEEGEEAGVGGYESYSDSGGESDGDRHDHLLSAIAALKGNRKRKAGHRSEVTPTVSEYHLPQQEGTGDHVTVRELLAGLEGGRSLSHLRKRLTTKKEGGGALEPPLPRPQADRVQRTVAYRDVSESISKWIPIVKRNREAEHLSFPLQEERPPLPSLTTKVEGFKPITELEREVAAVLEGSDNVKEAEGEGQGEGLSEAEQKALLRMSLEEASERRRELQRSRALMSYYEQKTRRTGKIKSKKYHRIQRRKREAAGARREGVGEGEEEMEKADRIRAKERMTLKHGSMARWARQQQARGHRDQATQQALTEHHQRKRDLKQRTVGAEESDSESEYSESVPSEDESSLPRHTPNPHSTTNPWLNASGGGGRKRSQPKVSGHEEVLLLDPQPGTHPLATVSPSHGGGGVVSRAGKGNGSEGPPSDFEPEEDPGERDSEEEGRGSEGRGRSYAVAEGIKKAKTVTRVDSKKSAVKGQSDGQKKKKKLGRDKKRKASERSDTSSKNSNRSSRLPDEASSLDTEGPTSAKAGTEHHKLSRPSGGGSHDIDPTSYMLAEEGGVALGGASQHLLNIQEAFAGEDVVGEFQREKAEAEEGSRPKEVDLTLPGWGEWGGEGVKPYKKRRKVVKPAEPEKPRKDRELKHVIISETHDQKASKHQVSSLPWPYTSTEQFEKALSGPIGRQWTSEASFRQLIQPAVKTAVGSIVEPLKMTEDVQDFIKRTGKKGQGRRDRRERREGTGRRKGAEKEEEKDEGTEKEGKERTTERRGRTQKEEGTGRREGKGGRRQDRSTMNT